MKTAMQDLINELKQFEKFPMVDKPTIEAAIEFAELRLEKEKQQIIEAYQEIGLKDEGDDLLTGEEYYNQTYNK